MNNDRPDPFFSDKETVMTYIEPTPPGTPQPDILPPDTPGPDIDRIDMSRIDDFLTRCALNFGAHDQRLPHKDRP